MASLKEIKTRIGSVQGTRKVTSAMKMVSSAKLHKAQSIITAMVPYQQNLDKIVSNFLAGKTVFSSPYVLKDEEETKKALSKVAVVTFSSNSSLCGAFNYNVIKEFTSLILDLHIDDKFVTVYPIGKKIEEAAKKMGFNCITSIKSEGEEFTFQSLAAKPDYKKIFALASELMERYKAGEYDKVYVVYQHFKSPAVQKVERIGYLPVDLSSYKAEESLSPEGFFHNYIVEPSVSEVITSLIPQVLKQKLYTCLADSYASEHAARTVAMQVATDNAEDLIQELTILYNKSRQQAITAELLDIVAGSVQ